jgi:Protein of unknown function (DUF4238)
MGGSRCGSSETQRSRLVSVRDAGVRTAFYRREHPDGTPIDDIEWSLSELERKTLPVLPCVADSWPLAQDDKSKLAFLFGYQLVRGPRWRAWFDERTRTFVEESVRDQPKVPGGGLETEDEIDQFEQQLRGSTRRTIRMVSLGTKVSGVLGSMHWTLLKFASPVLATCDHPVVSWPLDRFSQRPRQTSYDVGLFEMLEFRVPISPRLAILLTWRDGPDPSIPVTGNRDIAANLNAFTVAHAERQWFHSPERVPPIGSGQLLPLSRTLLHGYGPDETRDSQRRKLIQDSIQRRQGEDLPESIEMVVLSEPDLEQGGQALG